MRCVRRNVQRLWDLFVPFAEGTIGRAVLLAQQRGLRSKHKCAEMPKSKYLLSQARHCDCKRWVGRSGCQFIQIRVYVFLSITLMVLNLSSGFGTPRKLNDFQTPFVWFSKPCVAVTVCINQGCLQQCSDYPRVDITISVSVYYCITITVPKGGYYNHSNWHHDDSALSKRRHLGFATSAYSSVPKTIARLLNEALGCPPKSCIFPDDI